MPNSIEIANLALGNIKARTIQTFNEPSLEAQTCKARYDIARKYLLREMAWNFARKTEPLALREDTSVEFIYVYDYPSDCVKLQRILPDFLLGNERTAYLRFQNDYPYDMRAESMRLYDQPYEVAVIDGVKVVMSDLPEAHAVYTSNVEDTNLFDDQFVEAFSWWLASQIAVPIVGVEKGREMRKDALQIFGSIIREAKEANANEKRFSADVQSDVITAREY